MSRWVDEFTSHPFQATWNNLKAVLADAQVNDVSVVTDVTELARLRKVIAYLDEMVEGVDPELIPQATWDNFNLQATSCQQQITTFNSSRNISQLRQANAHADNLLVYLRPYQLAKGRAAKALQDAVKAYAATISESQSNFYEQADNIIKAIAANEDASEKALTEIENNLSQAKAYSEALFGTEETGTGLKDQFQKIFDDCTSKYGELTDYHKEIFAGDSKTPSTLDDIAEAKDRVLDSKNEISVLLEEVSSEVNELAKFHDKIFGKANKDGSRNGGLAEELNDRVIALQEFEKTQSSRYKALNEQIEGLLPGATSAGLASAYSSMKTSFNDPIKHMNAVFYLSLGLLVVLAVLMGVETINWELKTISFFKIAGWEDVLRNVANKIPAYAPVLWLAYFASKRRSEFQRLQQEYAHKEALAKSYDNYKKQIAALDADDSEMQKAFITKTVDAIAFNASSTLDGKHGDKMPLLEAFEKGVEKAIDKIGTTKDAKKD